MTLPRSSAQSRDGSFKLSRDNLLEKRLGTGANAVLAWKSRAKSRDTGSGRSRNDA